MTTVDRPHDSLSRTFGWILAATSAAIIGGLVAKSLVLAVALALVPALVLLVARPRATLAFAVASLPFPNSLSGRSGLQVATSDLLFLFVACALLAQLSMSRTPSHGRKTPLLPMALSYGLPLVLVLTAHLSGTSAIKSAQQLELTLLPATAGFLLFGERLARTALRGFVITSTLLALAFTLNIALGSDTALGVNKNPGGQYLANAILLLFTAPCFDRRWRLLVIPLAFGLLGAQSRGALLGLGAALIVLIMIRGGEAARSRLAAGTLALGALFTVGFQVLPAGAQHRILNTNSSSDYTLNIRQSYRTEAEALISAHPYLGIGVGNYIAGDPANGTQTSDPHNVALLVLAEGGVVLGLGFVALQAMSAVTLFRLRSTSPYAVSAMVVQLATLVHGFGDTYWVRGTPVMGWFLLGLALASRITTEEHT